MSFDAETKFEWAAQIAVIRQRFEAALRAGETLDSLDTWLRHVPEQFRAELGKELSRCRANVAPTSVETRIYSYDAAFNCAEEINGLFSRDGFDQTDAVDGCGTFQGLSKAAREALRERLEPKSFTAGTELLRQGEKARGLHVILSGSVDIVDAQEGERIDCDGAGSVLGEMSLLTGQPCSADVVATSDVSALVLSNDAYEELKGLHPELEIALSQLVSDRLGGRKHDALCGKTIGQYKLTHCINRGGMGVVYEANQIDTHEAVALKMLRHRFIYDDQMRSRFDQEAKLLADLRHPNIISLRDHFLAYRTRFLVLDLCDGSDLFRVLRFHGPLDEPLVRAILGQIAQGLLYAHQSGVIHCDLKPGNVLVDRGGHVKLTDFGLSRLLKSEVPEGKAVGTPSYMPPEQFRSEHVGRECDWYSLGCLACEMLTSRILFTNDDWMETFELKLHQKPSDQWPEINASSELKAIIHGALQPQAKDRRLDLESISRWATNVEGLFGTRRRQSEHRQ